MGRRRRARVCPRASMQGHHGLSTRHGDEGPPILSNTDTVELKAYAIEPDGDEVLVTTFKHTPGESIFVNAVEKDRGLWLWCMGKEWEIMHVKSGTTVIARFCRDCVQSGQPLEHKNCKAKGEST